ILRVEAGGDGVTAVLALRADGTRGIYRLEKGTLTRLSLLPDDRTWPAEQKVPEELAIGDAGQIAYVAPLTLDRGSPLALFQALAGQPAPGAQVFGPGQVVSRGGEDAVDGTTLNRFRALSSNRPGELGFLVSA